MKKGSQFFKKAMSVLLSVVLLASLGIVSSLAQGTDEKLKADANGNFKVLQVADVQQHETTDGKKHFSLLTLNTIRMAVAELQPDLIVLTGDNIHRCDSLADFDYSVQTLVSTFKGTPFAVTYGNHDLERNKDNGVCLTYKQEQAIYEKYGALTLNQTGLTCSDTTDYATAKYGTGYLDVYSADGKTVVERVILLNSGTYEVKASEPDGNVINNGREGYGRPGVNAKTYKDVDYDNVVKAVEKWTSEGIACVAYQHIPMQEFFTSGIIVEGEKGDVLMDGRQPEPFAGKYYKNSVKNTKINQFVEPCGCSYYSTESLYKAFAKNGNTLAVCYGHDHTNTVMGEGSCYGMKLVQGYGGGMLVYPSDYGEDSPVADYNPMVCLYTFDGIHLTKSTQTHNALLRHYIFGGYLLDYIKQSVLNLFRKTV
ncbi:MAG TPA: hypothetical protein DDY98_06375 [Ruminococcaceae bacterium]|nr:hypothetical protein [Oscillospiraceae bacterium]